MKILEHDLQQYLLREYPQENARCEWKEFKNLKNSFCGDEKMMLYPTYRLSPIWREGILYLELRIRRLKLSGQIFRDLLSMGNLQTHSRQRSNSQNNALICHLKERTKYRRVRNVWHEQASRDNTYPKALASSPSHCSQEGIATDRRFVGGIGPRKNVCYSWRAHLRSKGLVSRISAWRNNRRLGWGCLLALPTHQLPSYTKTKGLDKERLRQMVLQYLSNAGEEGVKRDSIYEYLKDVLPTNKTEEQQLRMLGDLLKNMSKECLIKAEGRTWYTIPQS